MPVTYRLLFPCLFGVAFAEAASGGEPATAATGGVKPGVVFIAEGVGGFDVSAAAARWAWPRAGVPHEVRQFEWSHGWGHVFKDLQDAAHLAQKARELAAEVRRVKADDPERPVYLVGKSGGSGLVLLAAEQLPPRTLERIILLSSAVSPAYDLRPALSCPWRPPARRPVVWRLRARTGDGTCDEAVCFRANSGRSRSCLVIGISPCA